MSAWRYSRDSEALSEYGVWNGDQIPKLREHFHSEAQLSVVITGCRVIRVGAKTFGIGPGECLYIPPECPHQTLPTVHPDTSCINAYISASMFGTLPRVLRLDRSLSSPEPPEKLFSFLRLDLKCDIRAEAPISESQTPRFHMEGRIAEIAAKYGVSREHFSRRFRQDFGVSPYAYSLIKRLNEGRRRLRMGHPIAAVAADLAFADQSHFGRLFRQTYGTTPRQYILGVG